MPDAEKDARERPVENLTFCNFRAPNGLPCTSVKAHHTAAHFTSDGRSWPGTYVTRRPEAPMSDAENGLPDDEQEWTVDDFIAECASITENPPPAPPGFEFIECTATPRHWPLYTAYVDGMYPAHCLFCERDDLSREIRRLKCERDHRHWKSWNLLHRLASWAYVTGLTSSGGGTSFGRCEFCGIGKQHTAPRWRGKRVYILGKPREWWVCLRRGHVYTPLEGRTFHLCAKCLPCSRCGSTDPMHRDSINCPLPPGGGRA